MADGARLVPVRFDLSALVTRSVATFYSQLVTRPTGQALRLDLSVLTTRSGARPANGRRLRALAS
jgi:hypothetical protein